MSDTLTADVERLPVGSLWEELRKQTSEEFKALSGAAREAGVQDRMFGVFHECAPGRRKLAVKVVDIFGNDTMTIVEVSVGGKK